MSEQLCHAPYNFVPLSDWVYTPAGNARIATHDIPFADGVSGVIDLTIQAKTPLLVAGPQDGPRKTFAKLPDGAYCIPGTALRGMIRNVFEIATFSRFSLVDNKRYSLRDLQLPQYQSVLTESSAGNQYKPRTRTGWLGFDHVKGEWTITPCKVARVEFDLLNKAFNTAFKRGTEKTTSHDRYKKLVAAGLATTNVFFKASGENWQPHSENKKLFYNKVTAISKVQEANMQPGTLVMTGDTGSGKHMEFVFFDAQEPCVVNSTVMREFLAFYDQKTNKEYEGWKTKTHHFSQGRIPVFYLEEQGEIASVGLSQMYKIPYKNSIGQLIERNHAQHAQRAGFDLTQLVFGDTADAESQGLRSRLSVGLARHTNPKQTTEEQKRLVLNSPKPTYYPNYLEQAGAGGKLDGKYSTMMDDNARLRGWKRYPARTTLGEQGKFDDKQDDSSTASELVLLKNAEFSGKIRFNNLRPEELGALLWAITLGGNPQLVHQLGMGKPFGYGQVQLAARISQIVGNTDAAASTDIEHWMGRFVETIDRAARENGYKAGWRASEQIRHLFAMAWPDAASVKGQIELQHMQLTRSYNPFSKVKGSKKNTLGRRFLPAYDEALRASPFKPKIIGIGVRIAAETNQKSGATLTWNKGKGVLTATLEGQTYPANSPKGRELYNSLEEAVRNRLDKGKPVKATVEVEDKGNQRTLLSVKVDPA